MSQERGEAAATAQATTTGGKLQGQAVTEHNNCKGWHSLFWWLWGSIEVRAPSQVVAAAIY
jgi:hypothetical protein